jgi:acyl-CoA reductase-like NAD-dependent aldehyde dehydrogenase
MAADPIAAEILPLADACRYLEREAPRLLRPRRPSPKLTPATLEVSGCDAAVVCADADIGPVVEALLFSLRFNGGASCIAPRRVLVHHTLADTLESRLVQVVCQPGPSRVGAQTPSQVQALVAEACQQGARQLTAPSFQIAR